MRRTDPPEGARPSLGGRPRLARALAATALVATALTAAELYRAGLRFGPLHKPLVYHLAAVAAASGAAWLWLRLGRRALPACAAALALLVYLGNDRRLMSGDTQPATLVPYALLRHGTLALDPVLGSGPPPAWAHRVNGRLVSQYPVTAGLLALPVYLPAALGPGRPGGLPHAEKLAAALMAAASVGFLLATLLALGLAPAPALLGAALYAFASPIFSTAAQALWQHAPGVLALSAGLFCAVRSRQDPRFEPWAGCCAGLAAAARPTNAVVLAALLGYQATRGLRPALRAAAGAAVPLALLAGYDTWAFGAPWRTGYSQDGGGFLGAFGPGLAGVLGSPTRGLLTYVPWAALGLLGLAAGARRDRLYAFALAAAAGVVAVHAAWLDWPGGWCYGPRLVTDATPLLALGLAPLLTPVRRRGLVPALLASGALAAWLAWVGAYRADAPLGRDVYQGSGARATEWWRYPPVRALRWP
ncbi:MAG TPA: hypothetical protein VFE30_16930 [Anaeromyxobacteraceae bacterium]|jgi:hypothetical protein|nr:hypothetical protein [Anaeromyxobacteraceae bacterium]